VVALVGLAAAASMEIVEKGTETLLVATLLEESAASEAMVALLDLLVGVAVTGLLTAEE